MLRDPGKILIIGAGPTALGAAYRFQELDFQDFRILEKADRPGGLATSFEDEEGFTWDIGGHVHFSHYAYYDRASDEVLSGNWITHRRRSAVWLEDRFVPYPFQYHIHFLEPPIRNQILEELEKLHRERGQEEPQNFKQWIMQTFGETIARIFLIPYNRKVWGYPVDQLNAKWVSERVAIPDVGEIRRRIRGEATEENSWGPNSTFRFPLKGGTGALWRSFADRIPKGRLSLGKRVVQVKTSRKTVLLDDGTEIRFDQLINTAPLDRFVGWCSGLDADLVRRTRQLLHSSVHIIGVGFRGAPPETLRSTGWMYFPSSSSPYYRVTVFSNYSPHHVPDSGCWSLMAEVCETSHSPVESGRLTRDVVSAMRRDGLFDDRSQVISTWLRREEYGYPTPSLNREAILRTVLPYLDSLRLFSRGRFGAWRYEVSNQDHSFMQGKELADRILGAGEEYTFSQPGLVNSGHFK